MRRGGCKMVAADAPAAGSGGAAAANAAAAAAGRGAVGCCADPHAGCCARRCAGCCAGRGRGPAFLQLWRRAGDASALDRDAAEGMQHGGAARIARVR
eukprot:130819-Chlamydomonas_euryale.AAC.2